MILMKALYRAAVAGTALVLSAGAAACLDIPTKEGPYQPVTITQLYANEGDYKNQWVSVTGLPEGCGDLKISEGSSQFCYIGDGKGKTLFLKRTKSQSVEGDYDIARDAFVHESINGDEEEVRALGRYRGDGILQTEYFEIDGVLYSVKRY